MHSSLLLGLLAALLSTAAAQDDSRYPGITANFTSPSSTNKSVDFYDYPTITWELPSDPSAPERAFSILTLGIVRSGPPTNTYYTPITDLDASVDTSFTWNTSRTVWEDMVESYGQTNPGQEIPRDTWWFEARLYTPETRNVTTGPYFRSSIFRAAYNETEDESGAVGVRASVGGAFVALAAAAWIL